MATYTGNNTIQTRIALKYDEYSVWLDRNPKLLKGEIAIATIPAGTTTNPAMQNLPNVVIKVGDGVHRYRELPFTSALAADVYDWAKDANKPQYSASEIEGLVKFIEDHSDIDTNTQYTVVATGTAYKYELKYKDIGESAFKSFKTPAYIDLSDLTKVATTANNAAAAIKVINGYESDDKPGDTGMSMREVAEDVVGDLDATFTAQGGKYIASVSQENGLISATYADLPTIPSLNYVDDKATTVPDTATIDVIKNLTVSGHTITEEIVQVATAKAVEDVNDRIDDLDLAEVAGAATGATIQFIQKVSQTDGQVAASLGSLSFTDAYGASNPAATKKYVDGAVTNIIANLNGAMHFVGVSSTDPAPAEGVGKVTIEGKVYAGKSGDVVIYIKDSVPVEFVFDGTAWQQLGNESIAQKLIDDLDATYAAQSGKYIASITQTDGAISATYADLPVIPDLSLTHDTEAEKPAGDTVVVVKDLSVNGHAITDEHVEVATSAAVGKVNKRIDDLNATFDKQNGKYIASITQTDGLVSATYEALPTLPKLSYVDDTSAETPTADSVDVITNLTVSGHTITEELVKVATEARVAKVDKRIDDLDMTHTAAEGKFIKKISQTDGLVSVDEEAYVNVKDLEQTANTYIIFNCGSATVNINDADVTG